MPVLSENREENVLTFKISLVPILMKTWGKNTFEIAEIIEKYQILPYVDACYEYFNTMGIKGVIEDIEDYIRAQGGSI